MATGKLDADVLRADSWEFLCRLCESHSRRMARLCKFPPARELITAMSQKFCAQAPPISDEDLHTRRMQETDVASIIGSVVHADGMARMWSSAAEKVFAEARKLVEAEFPRADAEFKQRLHDSLAFGVKIAEICHDEAMSRYKP
jgi:hypothetical protein